MKKGRITSFKWIKKLTNSFIIVISLFFSNTLLAASTWLYDANGNPSVLVDTATVGTSQTSVLYLSSGQPVGYVYNNGTVYSFDGTFFGWFSDGVLWDKNGYMLAYAQTSKPPTVTATLNPAPPITAVVKQEIPTVIKTPTEIITTVPNRVYQVSPTPITTYFSISPAQ